MEMCRGEAQTGIAILDRCGCKMLQGVDLDLLVELMSAKTRAGSRP